MPIEPVALQLRKKPTLSNLHSSSLEGSAPTATTRSPPVSPRPSISEQMNLPVWLQERTPSVHSRPSRASSVMSTRTGISVNTLQEPVLQDDARSIDLHFGEQAFRISRDGSRVTDHHYLPPYSTSPLPFVSEESSETSDTQEIPTFGEPSDLPNSPGIFINSRNSSSAGPPTPRSTQSQVSQTDRAALLAQLPGSLRSRLSSDPPLTEYTLATKNLNRHPSFTPGQERLSVDKRRTVSEGDILTTGTIPGQSSFTDVPFKRRNAIRLPRLTIDQSGNAVTQNEASSAKSQRGSDSPRSRGTQSAGPILKTPSHVQSEVARRDSAPSSPSFIGRDAPGIFPAPRIVISRRESTTTRESEPPTPTPSGFTLHSPATVEEAYAETHMPPAMDNENDISIHYTRMIRSIDRDHRRALHNRDVQMADLREKLHEKDTIYRQELRMRDFQIEDFKARLEHLERKQQLLLEKARNEVEDLWEARWKDRDRHLMERMRRIEMDSQKQVEQAVAERDREWAAEWASKQQRLMDRLRIAEGRTGNQS